MDIWKESFRGINVGDKVRAIVGPQKSESFVVKRISTEGCDYGWFTVQSTKGVEFLFTGTEIEKADPS